MKILRFVILSLLLSACAPSGYTGGGYNGHALEDSINGTQQIFANEATNAAIGANTQAINDSRNAAIMNSLGRRY